MKLNLPVIFASFLLLSIDTGVMGSEKSAKSAKSAKAKSEKSAKAKSEKSAKAAKAAKSAKSMKSSSTDEKTFKQFMLKYGKVYQTQEEYNIRFGTFKKSVREASALNAALKAKGKDQIHGVTKFSDVERDEFKQKFLGGVYTKDDYPVLDTASFETKVDATSGSYFLGDDGLLTPIKNQQQCGSCWAFSSTETLETAWAKAGNALVELSPQQIVSCDVGNGNYGCNGGWPSAAFEYVFAVGGLVSEADYPYTSTTGVTGDCTSPLPEFTMQAGGTAAWKYAQDACLPGSTECTEDVDAIATALRDYGGISIVIDASAFYSYTGDVMTAASCSSNPSSGDHAIQIVGYNADADTPYWIVRNSWGVDWGKDGYVFMEMGTNTCGLANIDALVTSL